jgi:8-oxo-dGTP pyrophosphatase MutT (NUDIX family)
VLTGDYGIGKSMTLRQLWLRLRARHGQDPVAAVPVHLNLRDHAGQEDPAEALHRHAARIGFGDPAQLVRAWRSGLMTLLLDGFDEITFPGWAGRVSGMADVRRRNVALLRAFVRDSPAGTGLILAGRSHFFDNDDELKRALDLPAGHVRLSASDFSIKQISDYLRVNNLQAAIPAWMPTRPLLVGYLAAQGLLTGGEADAGDSPAAGWHMLLDRICEREAQIEVGLDGALIRRIIERLASRARRTSSGRGPLRFDDLTDAFREVCGYQADEGSRVVLDRLPGLGVTGDDSMDQGLPREFVDTDLADAARAGDVYAYISSPRVPGAAGGDQRDWDYLLEDLGIDVVLHRMQAAAQDAQAASAALQIAVKDQGSPALTAELLRVVLAAGGSVSEPAPAIADLVLPTLTVAAGADAATSALRDCLITRLELEEGYRPEGVPRFTRCLFQEIDGATAETDLPPGEFEDCSFESFADSASNTAAILDLKLSDRDPPVAR